jgi:3,4-dihydroxy 2-butanone 4-phosphate synthase/GTP cyclohydrolase II
MRTRWGRFSARVFRGSNGACGLAIWQGSIANSESVLGRVHSSCFTSEGLGAVDCDCAEQLDLAFQTIVSRGSGIVFYLLQEGRGAGLSSKARDRMVVQQSGGAIDTFAAYRQFGLEPDPRSYELVAKMCTDLGIRSLDLLTNNPRKTQCLKAAGVRVRRIQLPGTASSYNADYLRAKVRHGHCLDLPRMDAAESSKDLDRADPRIGRFGRFVRVASYNAPILAGSEITWFRATAYSHESDGHERLILSHYSKPSATPVLRVFRDRIFARVAGSNELSPKCGDALQCIVAQGAGSILAIPDDGSWLSNTPPPTAGEDESLLHSHAEALTNGVDLGHLRDCAGSGFAGLCRAF